MKEIKTINVLKNGTIIEDMTNYTVPLNSRTGTIPNIIEAIKKRIGEDSTKGIA